MVKFHVVYYSCAEIAYFRGTPYAIHFGTRYYITIPFMRLMTVYALRDFRRNLLDMQSSASAWSNTFNRINKAPFPTL